MGKKRIFVIIARAGLRILFLIQIFIFHSLDTSPAICRLSACLNPFYSASSWVTEDLCKIPWVDGKSCNIILFSILSPLLPSPFTQEGFWYNNGISFDWAPGIEMLWWPKGKRRRCAPNLFHQPDTSEGSCCALWRQTWAWVYFIRMLSGPLLTSDLTSPCLKIPTG